MSRVTLPKLSIRIEPPAILQERAKDRIPVDHSGESIQ